MKVSPEIFSPLSFHLTITDLQSLLKSLLMRGSVPPTLLYLSQLHCGVRALKFITVVDNTVFIVYVISLLT